MRNHRSLFLLSAILIASITIPAMASDGIMEEGFSMTPIVAIVALDQIDTDFAIPGETERETFTITLLDMPAMAPTVLEVAVLGFSIAKETVSSPLNVSASWIAQGNIDRHKMSPDI